MKAAVLKEYGSLPVYADASEPTVSDDNQILVTPRASSIKQLDIIKAAGKHYTNFDPLPAVMGMDGVVSLENGTLAYASGITGMMAEQAIVDKRMLTILPDHLDPAFAASLPNTLMGSDMALRERGHITAGDVVLVNGATGATGSMAVQMAKLRGAKTVIATGRDQGKLDNLLTIGADETILMTDPDEQIIDRLKQLYADHPFNIVLDYLWGRPAELIMTSLSQISQQVPLTYITIGSLSGGTATVNSQLFRSIDLQLVGSGIGSIPQPVIAGYMKDNLAPIFQYAADGKLKMELATYPLSEVETAWQNGTGVINI